MLYNVYCDESCHLLNDGIPVMVLGGLRGRRSRVQEHHAKLQSIINRFNVAPTFEIKWTKVGSSGVALYKELLDYFFEAGDLGFRAVVVPDKGILDHKAYDQDHDLFYHKLYYLLLTHLLDERNAYEVYVDIKDTISSERLRDLQTYLANRLRDHRGDTLQRVQAVRSNEVRLLQLADLLIGAVGYANRGLSNNAGKAYLVEHIQSKQGRSLCRTTAKYESKLNLLIWRPHGSV